MFKVIPPPPYREKDIYVWWFFFACRFKILQYQYTDVLVKMLVYSRESH